MQFDKHGWRNRNRLKGPKGAIWLTVPVFHSGRTGQSILDLEAMTAGLATQAFVDRRAILCGFAGSKCRWLDIEYASGEPHPFSVKRLTDIPLRLQQLADV
jgi:hypothetical protein